MRILWLKTELLHPIDKGGKIRTYEMLKELCRAHEVTYLCLRRDEDTGDTVDRASEYCQRLVTVPFADPARFSARFYGDLGRNLVSTLPYNFQKYASRPMRDAIRQELAARTYDVVCCDFLFPAVNFDARTSKVPTVLFQHNVESALWDRQWRVQKNPAKRAFFYLQYRKLLACEARICRDFDLVVAVSDVDADTMKRQFGLRECASVPTGVDTETYKPSGTVATDPNELVFTGSMDWMPNEDAILWFVDDILPLIAREVPEVRLTVVGRNPTPRLQELAKRESRVTLTGRVDDVRPYIERAALYIVPLRVGGGTRLKIYEAMSMEKAMVSTRIGAEGLDVTDGQDLRYADDAESFARTTVELLRDKAQQERLAKAARSLVVERYGWAAPTKIFVGSLERAIALRGA
jgi:polysaccharide biosynthesis protein PslH